MKLPFFVNSLSTFLFKSVLCINMSSTAFIVAGHERDARAIEGNTCANHCPLEGTVDRLGCFTLGYNFTRTFTFLKKNQYNTHSLKIVKFNLK